MERPDSGDHLRRQLRTLQRAVGDPTDAVLARRSGVAAATFSEAMSGKRRLRDEFVAKVIGGCLASATIVIAHRGVAELEADVEAWTDAWNKDPKPLVWTKTTDEILDNLARYCQRRRNPLGRSDAFFATGSQHEGTV
jgi:hypothetical protein